MGSRPASRSTSVSALRGRAGLLYSFLTFASGAWLAGCDASGTSTQLPDVRPAPDPLPDPMYPTGNCEDAEPATAIDRSIDVPVASDFDSSANPSATTRIYFSMLLPKRCPGENFPLILHSHGYSGKRQNTIAMNGDLKPMEPHFAALDALATALPHHGYVVLSFDERGHGQSVPNSGGGNARIIDPRAETQDARALLDWAYEHSDEFHIQREEPSNILRDLKVGTLGYSYGGAFQIPLAAIDPRIDAIVPSGTWNNLLYSLLPGEGVKLSFDGLLCLLATVGGVSNTPVIQTVCNTVGVQGLTASTIRTQTDLTNATSSILALPRAVPASELVPFLYSHGGRYLETQERAGMPWGFGESASQLRQVPALFLQGNRDILFNATEAYRNFSYFSSTGADVRLLTTEGGHMNPLANQLEGTANCGAVRGVNAVLDWFNGYLKGSGVPSMSAIPRVCLSISDTRNAAMATSIGLQLPRVLVGSQSGQGGVPALAASLSTSVTLLNLTPVFERIVTISGSDKVLAGVPRITRLTVARGLGALQTAVAYVGVGIVRGGQTILVDDQLTAFVEGTHTNNRGVNNDEILLPAIGERLQNGDQVGLLFYQHHVQYAAVVSAASIPNATNIINRALGTSIPPVASFLDGSPVNIPNPYTVSAVDVGLPIITPGQYPESSLSQ